jgi:hypothetical protein
LPPDSARARRDRLLKARFFRERNFMKLLGEAGSRAEIERQSTAT